MLHLNMIFLFLISFSTTILLVNPVKIIAKKAGIIDLPNERKVHKLPTPRLGGVAIFLGVVTSLMLFLPLDKVTVTIGVGAILITALGFIDDMFNLRAIYKLFGQLLVTYILIKGGIVIERIDVPAIGLLELNNFSIIITFIWIVGIMNAINLIDGLDGLAAGITTIALINILILSIMDDKVLVIYLCIALIGSNIGFLRHNFHPATIYMGDSGSLFLGYAIAVISVLGFFKNVTLISFITPVIILALPIFDTITSILRRLKNGKHIMAPDKKHIHHKILEKGFSHKQTVWILYSISAIFGLIAVLLS